jgi:thiol-disulfide isomerase/thioredoxin
VIASLSLAVVLLAGAPAPHVQGIRWEHNFEDAMKKARQLKKPVVVDFWANWCTWCHRLDQSTYIDPIVVKMSADFVAVKVNTEGGAREEQVALRYDVSTLPTIAFLTPNGRQVMRLNGFQGPGQFPRTLTAARQVAEKVMAWEDAIERDPKDAVALAELGAQQFDQNVFNESRDLLYRAVKNDDARPVEERKRTRLLLSIIEKYDRHWSEAEQLVKQGLAIHAPAAKGQPIAVSEYDPKLLFVLGKTYLSWGRQGEARKVFERIVTGYPRNAVTDKAREVLAELNLR